MQQHQWTEDNPQVGAYRVWLWARIQCGNDLEELVKDAPSWATPVVATARERARKIVEGTYVSSHMYRENYQQEVLQ